MADIILTLSTERTVAGYRDAIARTKAEWVVFVHETDDRFEPLPWYFVLRPEEVEETFGADADGAAEIRSVMDLTPDWRSGASYGGSLVVEPGILGYATERVVVLSPANAVVRIAAAKQVDSSGFLPQAGGEEGGGRSFGPVPFRTRAPVIGATLFAGMPPTIATGVPTDVEYEIRGLKAGRAGAAIEVAVEAGAPIAVRASADQPDVAFDGAQEHTVILESSESTVKGRFTFVAHTSGIIRVAVHFRQSGADIGAILLAAHVAHDAPLTSPPLFLSAAVQPAASPGDHLLTLLIEERANNGSLFFDYKLISRDLQLNFVKKSSRPILSTAGNPQLALADYIQGIYTRATVELHSVHDARQLQVEAKGLGVSLSKELLEPEVVDILWPLRDRIVAIHIVSFEPRVPWELVRMQHPQTLEVDERFFADYKLTRSLSGDTPPRRLSLKRWSYLQAAFPSGSHAGLDADRAFFETVLPGQGIQPTLLDNTPDAVFTAVAGGTWDVLHLSCHAASNPAEIGRARLIIGERVEPGGGVRAVTVNSTTLKAEARLKPRRPIVFLNACETGVVDVVLTSYGGWPQIFCEAGAGVFVGTSWAVREKPAALFAATFYRHLLGGATLCDAATAAREAAKKLGDISWLAYEVYGDPLARIDTAVWPLSDTGHA